MGKIEKGTSAEGFKPVALEEEAGFALKDRLIEKAMELGGRVVGKKESPEEQLEESLSDSD